MLGGAEIYPEGVAHPGPYPATGLNREFSNLIDWLKTP